MECLTPLTGFLSVTPMSSCPIPCAAYPMIVLWRMSKYLHRKGGSPTCCPGSLLYVYCRAQECSRLIWNLRRLGHSHLDIFSEDDKRILTEEVTHRWRQTPALYYVGVTLFPPSVIITLPLAVDGSHVITCSCRSGNGRSCDQWRSNYIPGAVWHWRYFQ